MSGSIKPGVVKVPVPGCDGCLVKHRDIDLDLEVELDANQRSQRALELDIDDATIEANFSFNVCTEDQPSVNTGLNRACQAYLAKVELGLAFGLGPNDTEAEPQLGADAFVGEP